MIPQSVYVTLLLISLLLTIVALIKPGYRLTTIAILLTVIALLTGNARGGTAVTEPAKPWFEDDSFFSTLFGANAASLVVYPSYGADIKVSGISKPFGFGAALLYPVSEFAFVGGRIDFLGGAFWAPSAVVGAKYTLSRVPLKPTVFTVGGLIMPLGGAEEQNHVVGAITGVGATAQFWQAKDGKFSFHGFVEGEKWTNFEGTVLHIGVAGAFKF